MATKPATSDDKPTEVPAPSELPKPEAPANLSVANDEDIDEDGFIRQEVFVNDQKGPFLIGRSDIGTSRRVTTAEFASVGIQQETLIFEWKNGYRLSLEGINPAAVDYLVEHEYGFSVSET